MIDIKTSHELQEIILNVLEINNSKCLDNLDEREAVAQTLTDEIYEHLTKEIDSND